MASANEESFARRLWVKFINDSILALYTPFVVSLAAGNLEADALRNFSSQGIHFLRCYVQSLKLAEKYVDDEDDKTSIIQFGNSFLNLLQTHDSLVKKWGSDYTKEYTVNQAALKCTEFLFTIALGEWASPSVKTKVGVYTVCVMIPQIQLYAFIGKELQSLLDANGNNHPYKKWIDYYSSKYYQESTRQAEDLLDKLCVSLSDIELFVIQKFYHHAMRLELDFISCQPMVQKTVVPLLKEHNPSKYHFMVFSDFDLTCTVPDLSEILAAAIGIEIEKRPESDQMESENQITRMPSAYLRNTWGLLSREYTEEYEQCIENILCAEFEGCIENIILASEAGKFDYAVLKKALEQLSEFEKRANAKVEEYGLLLNLEDIEYAGDNLVLQDGCISFFHSITNNESISASIHVLSFCWCNDLIKSVSLSGDLHTLDIHANVASYEESISTGKIKVESPIDKVELFNEILKNNGTGGKNFSVYVGASVGDLLCLVEADIGIVIGPSENLRRVGSHFGVVFVPLFHALVKKQKEMVDEEISSCNWTRVPGILYTVSCWAEIHSMIVGSENHPSFASELQLL